MPRLFTWLTNIGCVLFEAALKGGRDAAGNDHGYFTIDALAVKSGNTLQRISKLGTSINLMI
tara:strand:- start:791 stop:976 length:186 start_codon:yes stop_codon:yes gene_type:complete